MNARAGSKIGRYEIVAALGRGAMGVVYKARDPKIDRLVAVKTISLQGHDQEDQQDYRERFVQEARAAGRLSHPGIVTIYDVGEDPDSLEPYMVMEYVPGESLKKVLSNCKRISLTPALQLAQELAFALHYAHSQGVVHRDIKPANILITPERHAKIADFGIAKLNLSNLTLPGQLLGSPSYMSPEQLRGDGIDARSDLFSLGVVIYTMIAGYGPFQGNSATTVCFKVVHQDPLPVTAFDANLPAELDRILAKSMAKDPADRYQDAAEFAKALQAFQQEMNLTMSGISGTTSWFVGATDYSSAAAVTSEAPKTASARSSSDAKTSSIFKAKSEQIRSYLGIGALALALITIAFYRVIPFKGNSGAAAGVAAAQTNQAAQIADFYPHDTQSTPQPAVQTKEAPKPPEPVQVVSTTAAPKPETSSAPRVVPAKAASTTGSEISTLQVEIDHPFKDANASIWLDNQLVYDRSLHGGVKKHAVVFHEIQGHQSDSILLAPGKHWVRVRVQTPDNAYDQSKTISAVFPDSAEMVLHIRCLKQNAGMEVTLQ